MAFQYAKNQKVKVRQIGKRCFFRRGTPLVWRHNSCTDTNAGSFHLILTNLIGIKKRGFIADLDRYKEVWNYGINGYSSQITKQIKNTIYVKTEVFYSKIIEPQYGNLLGTSFDFKGTRVLSYKLYLDAAGNISGGNWTSSSRPDFMWIQDKLPAIGTFSGLKALIQEN
jgi:hypothetical protein